jgi:GNAT superfamily N-acetyltransferase
MEKDLNGKIRIRAAVPGDAAVISEFNIRLALETEDLRLDPATISAGVAGVLEDSSKGLYFVAEVGGEIAGQVMITYEWSDWRNGNIWWLQSVYVKSEFRRLGVFRSLFEHLRVLASEDPGVFGLRLYMHGDNARARQAYERFGMKTTHYEVMELGLRGDGAIET